MGPYFLDIQYILQKRSNIPTNRIKNHCTGYCKKLAIKTSKSNPKLPIPPVCAQAQALYLAREIHHKI